MVTSEQVARAAGVSRTTVSRVLNGSPRISPAMRQRVHEAIASLGYEPDVVAQSLVRQRSRVIALGLFPQEAGLSLSELGHTRHYFYLDLLKHIEQATASAFYDLLMPSRPQNASPEHYIRSLRTRRVAGTVMLGLGPADSRTQALIQADIPTIFIDSMGQGKRATYVKSDNADGARQVVEHLLALGHRRIAFIIGQTMDLPGMERLFGSQQALAQAGLTMDPTLVRACGWDTDNAYDAAQLLLAERRDFTAIVAGSDLMAVGILRALYEHGLRVPDDLSVTGFDDVDLCRYTYPPLTTVRQDRQAMGEGAVQRLLSMIDDEGEEREPSPLIVPTSLVVRRSTGPAVT
jgi:DNA-binding LacI/PurR family transcriptional regulator